MSYITDHSTDSHKCVYKVPGVGPPDLSSPAACPDTLGILETGLHTYWQTAPWEKHSPSSQCQSLTINQQPTEALPRRALDRRTVVSEEKGLKCVCVCISIQESVASRMLRYHHNSLFLCFKVPLSLKKDERRMSNSAIV